MSEELDDRIELEGDSVQSSSAEEKAHYQKLMGETKKYRLSGMYKDWFLDYASYVILERAVPHIEDGFKPVQRRILHAMKKMDDGRYNKVANIIGFTMQFHPHGDASIGDALVQLGQKDLLIDCQGNWGNILTGDSSAAPRYIEARLTKFAGDVVFNAKTTEWMASYDGRNQEPVTLPVKFPLLLAQGVEGIAVGLASKILPHNFIELIDASIAHLRGEDFELYPDFPTAGMIDVSRYNDGLRGGAVKVRSKITKFDKKTLVITEVPFGKTTSSLIESIIKANDKGKIKIKKVDDNTARDVEIVIHLANDVSPDITIDALYAFTDCEVSISPNACTIMGKRPYFVGVKEMLRRSTERTKELLRMELDIRLRELEEGWHMSSLEKIFIENRIYNSIEECETWEAVIETIDRGLDPFKPMLRREVTTDDIVKLTEIKIKRISKFDTKKADEYIRGMETEMDEVKNHLDHLVDYTIAYFENIRKKYGKGRERKTEIRSFDVIQAAQVVVANEKLYVDRKEGFFGTNLKKEEFVCECSDIDDVIVFLRDGKYVITKVTDKGFVGKDIIHIAIFKKNDSRTIYNIVYRDGKNGPIYMKRCAITGITRDKEYDMTKGTAGSSILYMSANPNGEAEVLKVYFKPRPRLKKLIVDLNFSELAIKGRSSMGNIFTRYAIHKVVLKEKGVSTLGGQNIWFDDTIRRLNAEGRGMHLGEFLSDDKILVIAKNGSYTTTSYELTNRYEDEIIRIEKFDPEKVFSITYYDGEQKFFYVKRCTLEASDRSSELVGEHRASYIVEVNDDDYPQLEVTFGGANASRPAELIDVDEFIGVKSAKAKGKRVTTYEVGKLEFIEPLDKAPEPEEEELEDGEDGPIDLSLDPEDYSNAQQMNLGL
ncbi:DNA gyrase/topoisomerase IV subunit A [uncultured Acetobacteroides sp.]|uniref:DNA gyrase/topoisomerase IV subunit A n=1 Tax=uncultured Acetobacteroides sp. TaxID=1760811 RepID=UPI0029F59743|nr:DNA gyrase/topoisomerase IV subunit A [uncultured Acetobacteroides sp.]